MLHVGNSIYNYDTDTLPYRTPGPKNQASIHLTKSTKRDNILWIILFVHAKRI